MACDPRAHHVEPGRRLGIVRGDDADEDVRGRVIGAGEGGLDGADAGVAIERALWRDRRGPGHEAVALPMARPGYVARPNPPAPRER